MPHYARAVAIRASGSPLHADAFGAISSDGRTVVYPQGGGPHVRDLWVTRLIAGRWTAPALITSASPQRYNMQPAISGDGRRVLFDCGPGVPGDSRHGDLLRFDPRAAR